MAGSSRIEREGQPGINVRVKAKDNITITHEFDDSLEFNSTRKQLHSSKVFNIFLIIKLVMTECPDCSKRDDDSSNLRITAKRAR